MFFIQTILGARRFLLMMILVFCASATVTWPTYAGNLNPGIMPPNSRAFGTSYEELLGEALNWELSFPIESSPLLDETGEFGAQNQEGNIWFLSANFGGTSTRELTVPAGKAIHWSPFAFFVFAPEDGETEEELRAIAEEANDPDIVTLLEASVDGNPVDDILRYRSQTPSDFVLEIPEGSVLTEFGLEAGDRFPAVVDGWGLLLAPLSVGEHELHFRGVAGDIADPIFETDVTYHLTVVGRSHTIPEPSTTVLFLCGLVGVLPYSRFG